MTNRTESINFGDCCSLQSMRRFCSAYLRFLWKHKALFCTVALILHVTIYIAVRTITSARRLPPGKPLRLEAFSHAMREETIRKVPDPEDSQKLVNFSRHDLRLTYKTLPYIDPNDFAYDNVKDFQCQHRQGVKLGPNTTEDLMCRPRPAYLTRFRNPCYEFKLSPHKHVLNIHCVPYFHILGNDKCGTTDFHSRLTLHPAILPNNGGLGKETYYWCWLRYGLWMKRTVPRRRFDGYLAFFHVPSVRIVNELWRNKRHLITGDGTPMDFWDFRGWMEDPQNFGLTEPKVLTPHLMRHMYPNPKFIVLVRNPIDRLYSDYIFLGYGFSPEKFAKDVPLAIAMVRDCLRVNTTRQCFFSDDMYHTLPMRIHISCYSVFFREWLSVFHKNHFLVIRTEDYHSDMRSTLRKAFDFLNVFNLSEAELDIVVEQQMKHETVMKKKAGPMLPQTRALLEEFFALFNEDLAELWNDSRFLWKDTKTHRS